MRALKKDRRDLNVEIGSKVRSEVERLNLFGPVSIPGQVARTAPVFCSSDGMPTLFPNQEPSMADKFAGKVAVITGGSTGMGLATAKRFVQEGMDHVFITGRRKDALDRAVAEIGKT